MLTWCIAADAIRRDISLNGVGSVGELTGFAVKNALRKPKNYTNKGKIGSMRGGAGIDDS